MQAKPNKSKAKLCTNKNCGKTTQICQVTTQIQYVYVHIRYFLTTQNSVGVFMVTTCC